MHGPSTIIIEQALIGALLYYPEFRSQLAMLPAEDLSDATAKRAWRAMTEMHAAGRSISPVTLYAAIGVSMDEHDDPFAIAMDRARIGQKPEILDLVDGVRNEAGLRRLGHLKAIIEHEIYAQGARADTVVAELAQELSDIEASLLPGEETFVTHEDRGRSL